MIQRRYSSRWINFFKILFIKRYNLSFYLVDFRKIFTFKISFYSLWHTAYSHVYSQVSHQFTIRWLSNSGSHTIYLSQKFKAIPRCFAKFFVIHWIHLYFHFLRRNKNIFHILLYGNQRTRFQIIISSIKYQMLNSLSRLRK